MNKKQFLKFQKKNFFKLQIKKQFYNIFYPDLKSKTAICPR